MAMSMKRSLLGLLMRRLFDSLKTLTIALQSLWTPVSASLSFSTQIVSNLYLTSSSINLGMAFNAAPYVIWGIYAVEVLCFWDRLNFRCLAQFFQAEFYSLGYSPLNRFRINLKTSYALFGSFGCLNTFLRGFGSVQCPWESLFLHCPLICLSEPCTVEVLSGHIRYGFSLHLSDSVAVRLRLIGIL